MIKKFSRLMLVVAFALSASLFVACDKYEDDIERLDEAVAALQTTIQSLQSQISAGALITDVTNTADGVKVTLNNGKSFVVTNGEDGKDASVWTIGEDGFWYLDGNKTEYKALGVDGANGANGADGKYYVPNPETGNFDIYQDGKFVEATNISWKVAAGTTVILEGNALKFIGTDGKVLGTVSLGAALGSVAFVPDYMDDATSLPTTEKPFYTIPGWFKDHKNNGVVDYKGFKFVDMYPVIIDKSNEMEFLFRLNPSNAYVNGAVAAFVNRGLTVKAENAFNDRSDLMNVVETTYGTSGDAVVKATYNLSGELETKYDIAALQVWAGQNPVTSDYIAIEGQNLTPVLANTKLAKKGSSVNPANKTQYPNQWLVLPEDASAAMTDAWVKFVVGNVGEGTGSKQVFHTLKYDGELDLKPLVELFSNTKAAAVYDYLKNLGFTGLSYEFSKPSTYLADDDKKTNQQDYITLTDGVVKVNPEYKTSAVDRTPVIFVQAYALDNHGVKTLIRASLIKLMITKEDVQAEDKAANVIEISANKTYNYRELKAGFETLVGDMAWDRISKEVYDVEGLTSANFWDYYGGATDEYDVVVYMNDSPLGKWTQIWTDSGANLVTVGGNTGIATQINLNASGQESSYVKVMINNTIKTQHTYTKGANYKVEFIVPSDNKKVHGDFKFTQEFTVADEHRQYTFNELYHFGATSTWASLEGITSDDIIVVKGQLNANNTWEMSSVIAEHFANVDGNDIFTYYNKDKYVTNVSAIEFNWTNANNEVTMSKDHVIALVGELKKAHLVKNMTLTQTLANGEKCPTNYDVVFVNPFKAGLPSPLAVYANGVGTNTVSVQPEVLVIDNEGDAIFAYDAKNKVLALTKKATDDYKVAAPSVKYLFDVNEADYQTVKSQMSAGSKLDVDPDTGEFIWKNEGATLTKDYTVTVVATVTFANLSVVECRIPVKLSATKLQ